MYRVQAQTKQERQAFHRNHIRSPFIQPQSHDLFSRYASNWQDHYP